MLSSSEANYLGMVTYVIVGTGMYAWTGWSFWLGFLVCSLVFVVVNTIEMGLRAFTASKKKQRGRK